MAIGDLVFVVVIGGLAASIGLALGIFLVAPLIRRALDRSEEDDEAGDRPD